MKYQREKNEKRNFKMVKYKMTTRQNSLQRHEYINQKIYKYQDE